MKAQVNFYILSTQSEQDRFQFACKLAEKAFRKHLSCLIQTQDEIQSKFFDDLLWTFRAGSFVPHQLFTSPKSLEFNSILISSNITDINDFKLLINLAIDCPERLGCFERIFEIVSNNDNSKAQGRKKYRFYQESGLQIDTHLI